MFKHILVPLDGSQMAESALPAAAFLAAKLSAMITLIHVIEKNAPSEIHGQTHLKDTKEATAYLKEVSQRVFPEGLKVDCHVHTALVENVAESIAAHSDELSHDLIIMSSHGRGRALHLFLGSIAQKVISLGKIPVLVTHPREKGEMPEFSCKDILVPLDGDTEHAQALIVMKEMARAFGATLHLVVVIPGFGTLSGQMNVTSRYLPGTISTILEMSVQNAEEYLKAQLEDLRSQGIAASAHVQRGDPANVIVSFARQLQVDLITLATHGKSGMEAFWAGSVTHKVCSQCRIPLLLIPIERH